MTSPSTPQQILQQATQIFFAGSKKISERTALATCLALAGAGMILPADEAHASSRVVQAPQQADAVLSGSQWYQKLSQERHTHQDTMLLTEIYARLAAPLVLGRQAEYQLQDVAQFRTRWLEQFQRPLPAGGARALVQSFAEDFRNTTCGMPSDEQLALLGFNQNTWQTIVERQQPTISVDLQPMANQNRQVHSHYVQQRLEVHVQNLGLSWLRAPWAAYQDPQSLMAFEQGLVQTHRNLQNVTGWQHAVVGRDGRLGWDVTPSTGQAYTLNHLNGTSSIQSGFDKFPQAWLETLQASLPRNGTQPQSTQYERYERVERRGLRERVMSNYDIGNLITQAIQGNASQAIDNLGQRAAYTVPNAVIQQQQEDRQYQRQEAERQRYTQHQQQGNGDVFSISPELFNQVAQGQGQAPYEWRQALQQAQSQQPYVQVNSNSCQTSRGYR